MGIFSYFSGRKRYARKANKSLKKGINIKRRKVFSSTPFRIGTDDDCGGNN